MPLLGLIGYPLAHSFSPAYFKQKFKDENLLDWDYQAFPIESIELLPTLLDLHPDLIGFNVTIPHKTEVLKYCHTLSEEVDKIGAANFILIDPKTKLLSAYNTDYFGFAKSLEAWYNGCGRALVLGSGGSSKAIQYALDNLNISHDGCGRNGEINYSNVDLNQYDLIVNCTPIGMSTYTLHETDVLDLPYHQINNSHCFYDLVYNPENTSMMQRFAARGARVKNGIEMLHLQADKAWEMVKNL
jgi:shikimate dehydrogenase